MMKREIKIGSRRIGGNNPILIQSMTNSDTNDVEATALQMRRLEEAGCEIIRVAAYDLACAESIGKLKEKTSMPIVADVHFDYRIAVACIEAGADKVRINPGNIGREENVQRVADAAKMHGVPIRVGANSGSIGSKYHGLSKEDALLESTLENVRTLEKCGFYDIVIALKSTDVATTVAAYRKMDKLTDYPLHLGITEAGSYDNSIVKSAMGIGSLLLDGIGDTIRVSVTGDSLLEIQAAKKILQFSGRRRFGPEVISCPTCARTRIDLIELAAKVEKLAEQMDKPVKIAVMGCVVNGPGEARDADIGIAGENGMGVVFKKGQPVAKVSEEELLFELERQLKSF